MIETGHMSERFETQLRLHGLCLDGALCSLSSPEGSLLRFPDQGLNLFYGKSSHDGLKYFLSLPSIQGYTVEVVELSFLAHRPVSEKNWSSSVQEKNVFDLRQLSAGVRKEVADSFREYLQQYKQQHADMSDNEIIDRNPHLLDHLKSEPEFDGIDCFIWSFLFGNQQFSAATLFNRPEELLIHSLPSVKIPKWLV